MSSEMGMWIALGVMFLVMLYPRFVGKTSPGQARELVAGGAALVDVRSPGEFAGGHLPGAVNIPVGEIATRAKEIGATDRPVVVYCRSGARSASAASTLRGLGFKQVEDLGAMNRW